jgi:hypothetical protein
VEKLENWLQRQSLLFKETGWHSKLATVYFKICGEKPPIAFLEIVEGS